MRYSQKEFFSLKHSSVLHLKQHCSNNASTIMWQSLQISQSYFTANKCGGRNKKAGRVQKYKCKDTCRERSSRTHPTIWLGADWTRHHYRYILGTAVISHKKRRSEGTSSDLIRPSLGPKALHLNFCIQLPNIWTLFISGWRRERTGNPSITRAVYMFFRVEYGCTPKGTYKKSKTSSKNNANAVQNYLPPFRWAQAHKNIQQEGPRGVPKRRSQSTQIVLQPCFGLETEARNTTEPVQQSTLSSRASSHTEGLHNTKNFTSLAQT